MVLESTVYPGVTEEVLKPILEHESGLTCGTDFKIGYSPERINPGDDEHSLERITKIVSGMDRETTEVLSSLYGMITTVYEARDIRTAEAAKVIEKKFSKTIRHSASLQSDYRARERTGSDIREDGAFHYRRA